MISQSFRATALRLIYKECRLPGRWERFGDDFEGCVITIPVVNSGAEGHARITLCPARMKSLGWRDNEIKWKEIRRVAKNSYRLKDLFKEYHPATDTVSRLDYVESRLVFIASDTISVEALNRIQYWRRISGDAG